MGLGQFADLRGRLVKKRGFVFLKGKLIPQCTLCLQCCVIYLCVELARSCYQAWLFDTLGSYHKWKCSIFVPRYVRKTLGVSTKQGVAWNRIDRQRGIKTLYLQKWSYLRWTRITMLVIDMYLLDVFLEEHISTWDSVTQGSEGKFL